MKQKKWTAQSFECRMIPCAEPGGRSGTLYIEPGSPWENGYCESLNGKLRDECLNGEIFYFPEEAQIVIEKWRVQYNTKRPHSAARLQAACPRGL